MLKVLKSAFHALKLAMLGGLLSLSVFLVLNLTSLGEAYTEKYENAYQQMLREYETNVAFGAMLRSQRAWERSNETVSQAYKDERAQRTQLETELNILKYEMYTFYRVLDGLYPEARSAVEKQLGPRNSYYEPKPLCEPQPDTFKLQLTPEGDHAN